MNFGFAPNNSFPSFSQPMNAVPQQFPSSVPTQMQGGLPGSSAPTSITQPFQSVQSPPANTNETAIFRGMSALIREHILQPLHLHLKTRGADISVDEMAQVTMLAAASPSMPYMPTTGIANLPGSVSSGIPGIVPAAGKKSKTVEGLLAPTPTTCIYHFTRGAVNKDKYCPKAKIAGSQYCAEHAKKEVSTTAAPMQSFTSPSLLGQSNAFGSFGGMPTNQVGPLQMHQTTLPIQQSSTSMQPFQMGAPALLPGSQVQQQTPPNQGFQTFSIPTSTQQTQQTNTLLPSVPPTLPTPAAQQQKSVTISATPFTAPGGGQFALVEGPSRLVIRSGAQGQTICVGTLDATNNINTTLTPAQINEARSMNLTIVDTSSQSQQPAFSGNTQTTMFNIPTTTPAVLPTVENAAPIPQLPIPGTAAAPQASTLGQENPQIQTIPQLPIPTVATN